MSTLLKSQPPLPRIHSTDDLRGYFQKFAKKKGEERIGIECELFGVHELTGEALPYRGPKGIEAVLRRMAREFDYELVKEDRHVIALKRGETMISLEPGGQVELSAEPVRTIHHAQAQLNQFFLELRTVGNSIGKIAWLATGIHPFSELKKIEWVPKTRYQIMARYLGARGKHAHDMMKRTATNQINLDYFSEEDAIEKMRIALIVTPIAAAMFANSNFSSGKLGKLHSERLKIWRFTDPDRSGLILKLVCEHCSFQDYLDYVLSVPMMFIVRNGKWMVAKNLTFKKFVEFGYRGFFPTESDFELHLSTIFTDVRFKQYLEVRGMDGQRAPFIPAVYAFWKGILYSEEARRMAKEFLAKRITEKEILSLHHNVEKDGLGAKVRSGRLIDWARELVRISELGLTVQRCFNSLEQDERIYLEPFKNEVLKKGKSPADALSELWQGKFQKDPKQLIQYLRI